MKYAHKVTAIKALNVSVVRTSFTSIGPVIDKAYNPRETISSKEFKAVYHELKAYMKTPAYDALEDSNSELANNISVAVHILKPSSLGQKLRRPFRRTKKVAIRTEPAVTTESSADKDVGDYHNIDLVAQAAKREAEGPGAYHNLDMIKAAVEAARAQEAADAGHYGNVSAVEETAYGAMPAPDADDSDYGALPGTETSDYGALPGTETSDYGALPGTETSDYGALPGTETSDYGALPSTGSASEATWIIHPIEVVNAGINDIWLAVKAYRADNTQFDELLASVDRLEDFAKRHETHEGFEIAVHKAYDFVREMHATLPLNQLYALRAPLPAPIVSEVMTQVNDGPSAQAEA